MKLLVIRHGVAMEREEYRQQCARESAQEPDDGLRPLTSAGIRKMDKNARGLAKLVNHIDVLVTSPLVRAVQTAQMAMSALRLWRRNQDMRTKRSKKLSAG